MHLNWFFFKNHVLAFWGIFFLNFLSRQYDINIILRARNKSDSCLLTSYSWWIFMSALISKNNYNPLLWNYSLSITLSCSLLLFYGYPPPTPPLSPFPFPTFTIAHPPTHRSSSSSCACSISSNHSAGRNVQPIIDADTGGGVASERFTDPS